MINVPKCPKCHTAERVQQIERGLFHCKRCGKVFSRG